MDPYKHILTCVDFSESSGSVLQRLATEARFHGAALMTLHVIEYYPTDVPPDYPVPPENADPIEIYESRERERMRALAGGAGCKDARLKVATAISAAYHEIVQCARDNGVDLVVMGYHGRWGRALSAPRPWRLPGISFATFSWCGIRVPVRKTDRSAETDRGEDGSRYGGERGRPRERIPDRVELAERRRDRQTGAV